MFKMSKIVAPALLASLALGAVAPAQAATPLRAEAIRSEIVNLQRTIDRIATRDRYEDRFDGRFRDRDGLSQREAFALRRDVSQLRDQFRFFNRDGLSRGEYRILDRRIDSIKARLRFERNDRDNRRW